MHKIIKKFTGENRAQEVQAYFLRYHPFGYGTEVVRETDEEITVERWSSCD
jgi:hypothetical protein